MGGPIAPDIGAISEIAPQLRHQISKNWLIAPIGLALWHKKLAESNSPQSASKPKQTVRKGDLYADVYLVVIVVGDLLAIGAAGIGVVADSLVDLDSIPDSGYRV